MTVLTDWTMPHSSNASFPTASQHALAHMARARPLVFAAGSAVLRENEKDKTAEAFGQYGDACVRCSC
jgi:hypothetical protein